MTVLDMMVYSSLLGEQWEDDSWGTIWVITDEHYK